MMILNMFYAFCILCQQSDTSRLTTGGLSCHYQAKALEKVSGDYKGGEVMHMPAGDVSNNIEATGASRN